MNTIYLDYNASAPLRPGAWEAMLPWLCDFYANPSSTHLPGQRARAAIDEAREDIAAMLGCNPNELFFTSGGTESDNIALAGLAGLRMGPVALSRIEHPAIVETARVLTENGRELLWIDVDADGLVDMESLDRALAQAPAVVAIMQANNETGVIQDLEKLAARCLESKTPLLSDCIQGVGKIPLDLSLNGLVAATASAHKFGGPRGAGLLYLQKGYEISALLHGGEQEGGIRPGTENVAAIVGMAAAMKAVMKNMRAEMVGQGLLRDSLENYLIKNIEGAVINSSGAARVANTLSICLPGVEADILILKLDAAGVHVSAGSACAAGAVKASHVLKAMGRPTDLARGSLRFSLGVTTSMADIERAGRETVAAWKALRS